MIKKITALASICILFSCKPDVKNTPSSNGSKANTGASLIHHQIVGQWPHDIHTFTEGLLFHNGKIYESTGAPDMGPTSRSVIGELDMSNGKLNVKVEIDKHKFFGEGLVFLNNKLYQLTYKNQIAFIYDAKTFKPIGNFKYTSPEGWGLTTDGANLIMSDGTDKIHYIDDETYKVIKTINVKLDGRPLFFINELELINNFIYANVWQTNYIVKIDPSNGNVVGKLDLTDVVNDAKSKNPKIDSLNGIAFDTTTNQIFVTGKYFPNIYQINFPI